MAVRNWRLGLGSAGLCSRLRVDSCVHMLPVALLVSEMSIMLLFTIYRTMLASNGQRAYLSMSALMLVLCSGSRHRRVMCSNLGLLATFVLMNLMKCG